MLNLDFASLVSDRLKAPGILPGLLRSTPKTPYSMRLSLRADRLQPKMQQNWSQGINTFGNTAIGILPSMIGAPL